MFLHLQNLNLSALNSLFKHDYGMLIHNLVEHDLIEILSVNQLLTATFHFGQAHLGEALIKSIFIGS